MKGRTTITVAHRLSTVKTADCIYVIIQGVVRESGTHEQLLGQRGRYWEMCKTQSLDQHVTVMVEILDFKDTI
jgi:ATP-binding cassette subfamily B (MDR/TAP) protein 1